MFRNIFSLMTTAVLLASLSPSANAKSSALCVFDPGGANGDIYNLMKDYRVAAKGWSVDFKLKPYTDEKTAAEDFKAGQCKAVLMTGTRVRQFHSFAGTIEAMGALPSYDLLHKVVRSLSGKKAKSLMQKGDYEVAGIFPGGAIYLLVRDRKIDTVAELAGKRVATLEYDVASKTMVRHVGAAIVAADVGTFSGMFNNGSVDAAYAPATAYKALELYKGIGSKGGVINYPLAQMTLQLLIRTKDFPENFGLKSRSYSAKQFTTGLNLVKSAEKVISSKHWIQIPDADKARYDEMFLNVRVGLRDKEKLYNPRMLKLLRKVRCKKNKARAECAEKRE
jgi:hypothetical protein